MVLSVGRTDPWNPMGKKDSGRHTHMGKGHGRISRSDKNYPRQISKEQHHDLKEKAGAREKNTLCRTHYFGRRNTARRRKVRGNQQIPTTKVPRYVKDIRSFLGLAQQLASFVPDLAHMTSMLRPLLKKDIAWTWTVDHDKSSSCLLYTSPSPRD